MNIFKYHRCMNRKMYTDMNTNIHIHTEYIYTHILKYVFKETPSYIQYTLFIFCVHYLCLIGRVYVFYVGHLDKSSLYETLFHCNILSKHHHHHKYANVMRFLQC
jgi:hypothetical protein